MLKGDRVLVAHGLEVVGHNIGQSLGFVLGTEGADALDLLGQYHVVVGNVRDGEAAQLAFTALAEGARRADR